MPTINITFTHTNDPYLSNIEVETVPRPGDDFGVITINGEIATEADPAGTPIRLDKVVRIRHYLVQTNPGARARPRFRQEIHVILDRDRSPSEPRFGAPESQ